MDLLYIHTVDSYGQGEELIRFWAKSVAMATRYLKKMNFASILLGETSWHPLVVAFRGDATCMYMSFYQYLHRYHMYYFYKSVFTI